MLYLNFRRFKFTFPDFSDAFFLLYLLIQHSKNKKEQTNKNIKVPKKFAFQN